MTDKEKFEKIIIKLTKGDGTLEDLKNASTFKPYGPIKLRINSLKKQYGLKKVIEKPDVVLIDCSVLDNWRTDRLINNFKTKGIIDQPWLNLFHPVYGYDINIPFINTNLIPISTSTEVITDESYNKLKSMISSTDRDTVKLAYKLISQKYSFELNQEKITLLYLSSNNTFYPGVRTTKEIKNTVTKIKNLYPNFR